MTAVLLILLLALALWLEQRLTNRRAESRPGPVEVVEANTPAEIDRQLREAESRRYGRRPSDRPREVITRADADWLNQGAVGTNVRFRKDRE